MLLRREAPVQHGEDGVTGWVDHIFLDDLGVPTLVEVKRSSDARIRREVVGQLLDYAANVAFEWSVDAFQRFFENECRDSERDPDETLAEHLQAEMTPDDFWGAVKTNLQAGRIRLLFVADVIPSSLERIIEFLNNQMDPCEVLGVELRQFTGDGVRTLVPRLVGMTAEADLRKRRSRHWDEDSFFERLSATAGQSELSVARRLLDWAMRNSMDISWGRGRTQGSFAPFLRVGDSRHNPFVVYSGTKADGVVEIQFQWLAGKAPYEDAGKRRELRAKLNAIDGIHLPEDCLSRRPSISLAILAEGDRTEQFLRVFDWYLREIHAANA